MGKDISLNHNQSFVCLTAAQFLGVINDHIFKMVVALFAVGIAVQLEGSSYLSLSSVLFVAPYILFSNYAGRLADRHSKRSVLVGVKFAEIVIMLLGLLVLGWWGTIYGLLFVLFLMAAQSTFFSPSKFGYIPEIVPNNRLLAANGILEASRYTAVILGTLAGGLLMELWRDTPIRIGIITVAIAVIGFLCTLGTRHRAQTGATNSRIRPADESLVTGLSRIAKSPLLAIAVASITFFESMATLVCLDILLLAKIELGIGDGPAGILPACAAIGAGFGAYLCGRICGSRVELGMTPIAGTCLAGALFATAFGSTNFQSLAVMLVVIGMFGGMYFLPCQTWLQRGTSANERGLIISTNNFVNMLGVLSASGALWILHDLFDLTPRTILVVCALATMLFVFATATLSGHLRKRMMLLVRHWFRSTEQLVARCTVYVVGFDQAASNKASSARLFTGCLFPKKMAPCIALLIAVFTATSNTMAAENVQRSTYQIRHQTWGNVGELTQNIALDGSDARVVTRIAIRVSLLGLTIHWLNADWYEEWSDGILTYFKGTTVTNGDTETIIGHRKENSFDIQSPRGMVRAPVDVQPINPWSPQFVKASVFMSPETGRLTRSQFVDGGIRYLELGDKVIEVQNYHTTADGEHALYFDEDSKLIRFEYSDALGKVIISRLEQ